MKIWAKPEQRRIGSRCAVAGLMLVLWLAVLALTSLPQLHRLLHQDAQRPDHQCLITQLQHQPLLAGFTIVLAPAAPLALAAPICGAASQFLPLSDYRFSPSRAPPSVFLPVAVVG